MSPERWDTSLAELREQLAETCASHLPPDDAEFLTALARPAIRMSHSAKPAHSHLGGAALLPKEHTWPNWEGKPLALVAVVDVEDLAGYVTDAPLPSTGVLNFFYEADEQQAWGFEPRHKDGWRVVLADRAESVEVNPPAGTTVFERIDLAPTQILTLPGWEEPSVERIFPPHAPKVGRGLHRRAARRRQEREDAQRKAFWAIQDAWRPANEHPDHIGHQIGGWPKLVQAAIWRECDIVSRGYPLGTSEQWRDPQIAALDDTQDDWRLLLQLDSDDDAGWMWGDVGSLYFAVRESTPDPRRFDEVWMVLQCG